MHQKGGQASSLPGVAFLPDEDGDEETGTGPCSGDEDRAEPEGDVEGRARDDGRRESWWRGVVASSSSLPRHRGDDSSDNGDDDDEEEDEEDEFGDFAMAEDDHKTGEEGSRDEIFLRPLSGSPVKESSRGLSGLWPFGSRAGREMKKQGREEETLPAADEVLVPAMRSSREDELEEDERAVEVRAAARRTSIEDPDEEEIVVGAEILAGTTTDEVGIPR